MSKDNTVLVLVESPNKIATLSQFLPKNYVVKASVGHISEIKNSGLYNMGIDVKGNFDIDFIISDSKKETVKELKKWVEKADIVYVCSDEDREGEAIAYHLKNFLSIPKNKFKRATFHEITKKAVTDALDSPRDLDMNMVDAALSRASLDKIIGFRLSPIARKKVSAKSVGRCQSPALRLIVDREEEIVNFDSKKYYEIWLPFTKNKLEYKAQYKGLIKEDKNKPTIEDKELAEKIIKDCKGYDFILHNIECSDRVVSSKDPFITSTFQQEASSKLGLSVKGAMGYAQKLFEGINVGGQHIALITYLRTDDISMDPEFKDSLKEFIKTNFGDKYLKEETKKKTSKKKNEENVQAGHECLRCIDLNMTPEKLSQYVYDQQLIKVYELIYNRTVASLMSDAIITDVNFIIKNGEYKFIYSEHSCKFDGFKRVYNVDEEELNSGLDICVGEKIKAKKLQLLEKSTQPPRRYSESSLVKALESSGVGRPSTFASIISTLLDPGRGYCEETGKALAPTEKGINLIHYLKEAFPDVVDVNYTSKMEESLDKIAKGELNRVDYLKGFYKNLEEQIKTSKDIDGEKEAPEKTDKVCPQCGKPLVKRNRRFGSFYACSGWKYGNKGCNYTEKIC